MQTYADLEISLSRWDADRYRVELRFSRPDDLQSDRGPQVPPWPVETYKSIVRQPYDRLEELVEIADHADNEHPIANIADKQHPSAKHEGAPPEVEETREYPSDILDYFRDKSEIEEAGEMGYMLRNYGTCAATA
jgi:hypothetical protein